LHQSCRQRVFQWFINPGNLVNATVIRLNMYVPPQLTTRIEALSIRLGCALTVVRCWKNDGGRPRMYCDFRGVLHRSPELLIELAGTLCAELSNEPPDEIDLFVFINGRRVGVCDRDLDTRKYLIGYGGAQFVWDYNDEGFDQFMTLDAETFTCPIHKSLAINPPEHDEADKDG
jgi:hypothetical protein